MAGLAGAESVTPCQVSEKIDCVAKYAPPEILCIEEIENGLDPRAIGLLVEEIRYAIKEEERQLLATTHSP